MSKSWIQVVGTYNRQSDSGTIVAVQPAREANLPTHRADSPLAISVETDAGAPLSSIPITPEFGSCGDVVDEGTFQAFFELPAGAAVLRLVNDGQELAVYHAAATSAADGGGESFGLGIRSGHSVPLTQDGSLDPNASYTLQGREKGSSIWQTLDVGMEHADVSQVDLNQFPGANAIEVRILKSAGFDTTEIDRTEINLED